METNEEARAQRERASTILKRRRLFAAAWAAVAPGAVPA